MQNSDSVLARIAKRRLAERNAADYKKESIYGFINRVTPHFLTPHHLELMVSQLERIRAGESLRLAFSVPPRHSKTETLLHFIAKYLLENPRKQVMYITHGQDTADEMSLKCQQYYIAGGGSVNPRKKGAQRWLTEDGGGLLAVGIGGQVTGRGADLLVIDDPHKGRESADSQLEREAVHSFITGDAINRLQPKASVILNHTRWHPDDAIGHFTDLQPKLWIKFNIPAIKDDGSELWPEYWPMSELQAKRDVIGEFEWASQYMGSPRPRDGAVFKELPDDRFYDTLPDRFTAMCIGIDLAYTEKTYSDYSCAVLLGRTEDKKYYIIDVVRKQCSPVDFVDQLARLSKDYGCGNIFWYISGVEKSILPFLKNNKIHVKAEVTSKDKYTRSIEVSTAWNRGDVYLPKNARWLDIFLKEVLVFTGVSDAKDDQVDALAAAYSQIGAKHTVRILGNQRILPF